MKNCPNCSKDIGDKAKICKYCKTQMNQTHDNSYKKSSLFKELWIIFGFGSFLGIAHNYLFYGLKPGISVPIFAFLFLLSIFTILKILKQNLDKNVVLIGISIFIFSLLKAIRIGDILTFLNTISIYLLSLLLITIIIKSSFEKIFLSDYILGFFKLIFKPFLGIIIWFRGIFRLRDLSINKEKRFHIIKGIIMSLPLLFIFSILFSSADLVFAKYLKNIFDFNLFDLINGRFLYSILFGAYFTGLFSFIWGHIYAPKNEEIETKIIVDDKKHIEINIVLSLIGALFLLFLILQVGYLFSGEKLIGDAGFTYSEYARKGFFELAVVASIVFLLFWKIDDYLYGHKLPSNSHKFKYLSAFLIIETLVILVSAFYRLWLYESAYGFTEIRFYGYVFIIILAISFFVILYKIFYFIKEGYFIVSIFSLYFAGLFICNIINPESFISESNIKKEYRGSVSLDSFYIGSRSADAVDDILATYNKTNKAEEKKNLKNQLCNLRKKSMENMVNWQQFNYSYYHTIQLVGPRVREFKCTSTHYLPKIIYIFDNKLNSTKSLTDYKKVFGENEVTLYYEGMQLYNKGSYPQAIEKFKQGIDINNDFERNYLALGNTYKMIGYNDLSYESYYNGSKNCEFECSELNYKLGNIEYEKGDYNKALEYYNIAYNTINNSINGYNSRFEKNKILISKGDALFKLGNFIEVINLLKDINFYNLKDDEVSAAIIISKSYYNLADYQNAISYVDKGLTRYRNNQELLKLRNEVIDKLTNKFTTGNTATGSIMTSSGSVINK